MNREEKVELLSAVICKRSPGGDDETCPLCIEDGRCRVSEKTDEQLDYVLSSIKDSIFLQACPGSGKTEVIGLKAAYEIKNWAGCGGIAVLTFTNNAANVISDRVSRFAGVEKLGFPHFVGTIDSWLHSYVGHPFSHIQTGYQGRNGDKSMRLIDHSSNSDFLNAFKTKYTYNRTGNPSANQYVYDYDIDGWRFNSGDRRLDQSRSGMVLVDWQNNDLKTTKNKFLRAGFATYQDIENTCINLLLKNENLVKLLAKRFPFIIVDECQDLSSIQLCILEILKQKGMHVHFVGDLDQAIYEFKKVDPLDVKQFVKRLIFAPMHLTKNFRSCQSVISLCQELVPDYTPVATAIDQRIEPSCVCISYSKQQIPNLPDWFSNYLEANSLDPQKCKIVSRGWSTISKLRATGRNELRESQRWLSTAIDLWKAGDKQSLPEAINLAGRFVTKSYLDGCVRNKGANYCPEGVDSGLEWRIFIANVLDSCCQNARLPDLDSTWSNWAGVVRDDFPTIVDQAKHLLKSAKSDLVSQFDKDFKFQALRGHGNNSVRSTLQPVRQNQTDMKITTIHDVKGETLDAIMVVSSPTKAGSDGHWEQWLEDKGAEAARMAYVASSRPQHLLVWAVPEINDAQEKRLEGLGFNIQVMED